MRLSILTLTYQRHHLLEEAIQSYLLQLKGYDQETEIVVINDSIDVKYYFNHPNVRIINCEERFSSVGKKLEWGFKQCKGDWIYRLDDDDLLSPYALKLTFEYTSKHVDKDIVRDDKHYFFTNNIYNGISGAINTGNCYNKKYIQRVGSFIDESIGEDDWLTFKNRANVHTEISDKCSMIYRWGMGTYHISGMGNLSNDKIYQITDNSNSEMGHIDLTPHFREDYWSKII